VISLRVVAVAGAAVIVGGVVAVVGAGAGGATGVVAADHHRFAAAVGRVAVMVMVVLVVVLPSQTNDDVGHCLRCNSCCRSGVVMAVCVDDAVVAVAGDVEGVNGGDDVGEGDFRLSYREDLPM
jgi:hypothetical protein